jgi:MFS transporter, PAT family, solute carrier family 33 (acetyl-CoA transportor), member 1
MTPWFRQNGAYSSNFYLLYGLLNGIYAFSAALFLLSITACFTKMSDPNYGGTYMTLFNTISNIGKFSN